LAEIDMRVGKRAGGMPPILRCNTPEFASPCFPHASPTALEGPGKQKTPRRAFSKCLIFLKKTGAGEAIRTLDPNLGKQKITLSSYSGGVSQISLRYSRWRVLSVFVGLATYERNGTPMN
jgi:hypothetical protein